MNLHLKFLCKINGVHLESLHKIFEKNKKEKKEKKLISNRQYTTNSIPDRKMKKMGNLIAAMRNLQLKVPSTESIVCGFKECLRKD